MKSESSEARAEQSARSPELLLTAIRGALCSLEELRFRRFVFQARYKGAKNEETNGRHISTKPRHATRRTDVDAKLGRVLFEDAQLVDVFVQRLPTRAVVARHTY